jgi:hypothetical protein
MPTEQRGRRSGVGGGAAANGTRSTTLASPASHLASLWNSDAKGAIERSRFPVVRSELFYALSWANPALSAALAATALAAYLSLVVLRYSPASLAAHLAVTALLLSGAVAVHNGVNPGAALPQLALPYDRDAVLQLGRVVAEAAVGGLARANALLSWEEPLASARALCYAWLAARYAWALASPGAALLAGLGALVAAPAYLRAQPALDAGWTDRALPALRKAAAAVRVRGREMEREELGVQILV